MKKVPLLKIDSKTKKLLNYFILNISKNKFSVAFLIVFSSLPVMANIVVQIVANNSANTNIEFNKTIIYIIITSFFSLLSTSLFLVYLLFINSKNNGSLLYLYTLDYDRRFLYLFRVLFILLINALLLTIIFVINIIINFSFRNISGVFFLALYVISFIFLLFFTSIFVFYSYLFKASVFMIVSLMTIVSSIGLFFVMNLKSIDKKSNILEFNKELNVNNYSNLYLTDNNGNSKGNFLILNKQLNNHLNTSPSLNDAFERTSNGLARNLSALNVFSQSVSSLQELFGGKRNYSSLEINQISKENYAYNYNLFELKNYKNGEPNQIDNLNYNKVFVSFQDQNPFLMSYDSIYSKVSGMIDKLELDKNSAIIRSITSKTSNENYWSNANVHLTEQEINLLRKFSGVENEHWLFYIHNYYSLIKNKLVKLKGDLENQYGSEIANFVWSIFNDEKYRNNLIKFNTLLNRSKIYNRFPMIGTIDNNKNADSSDIEYFKHELIHFVHQSSSNVSKILQKNSLGYKTIDLSQIDPKITSQRTWEDYIDNNLEVVNLKNIYNKLFQINNDINPEYSFSNNIDDIYLINRVAEIRPKPWIKNIWIHLLLIITASTSMLYFTRKIAFKYEGKHIE